MWAVNCPCKDDPSDKVCNCNYCKPDDVSETLKSKQIFESLMWKPNCSKFSNIHIYILIRFTSTLI